MTLTDSNTVTGHQLFVLYKKNISSHNVAFFIIDQTNVEEINKRVISKRQNRKTLQLDARSSVQMTTSCLNLLQPSPLTIMSV